MEFVEKAYARLCIASNEVALGERRGNYFRDVRYLENFLLAQNVNFEVVRKDSHDAELTPYIDLKEVGDVPARYIPDWLKDKKIRANAVQRISRIKKSIIEEAVDFLMSKALPKR